MVKWNGWRGGSIISTGCHVDLFCKILQFRSWAGDGSANCNGRCALQCRWSEPQFIVNNTRIRSDVENGSPEDDGQHELFRCKNLALRWIHPRRWRDVRHVGRTKKSEFLQISSSTVVLVIFFQRQLWIYLIILLILFRFNSRGPRWHSG